MNEVDEVIRELKKNKGFNGFVIMNNDGGCLAAPASRARELVARSRPARRHRYPTRADGIQSRGAPRLPRAPRGVAR